VTVRRKPRRREAQLAFEAITIEGGLLSADWLARAAQLSAGNQSEADYRLPKGLNLRDEIGRFWRVAQAHWREFAAGRSGGADAVALAKRFVHGLLREAFGFASLAEVPPVELEGRTYPVGAMALGKRVPVVVAPAGSGLDTLSPAFGDAGRRRSVFGLAQELLNASDDALWGIACDGVTLRILRDNASLTRPAWIEADLAALFTEERYADFAALWLIAHETRFGAADRPPAECALETWRAAGREEGTRAREHLRQGVEDAIVALGKGFLSHPDNPALRSRLESGALTRDALFQQLLRLVYRLIFLLTVEERGVLHAPGTPDAATSLYAQGYSVRRLRDRSVRRSGYDRFGDLWDALRIVLRGMARGEPRLGLPALGGLFGEAQCADLDAAKLENRALLTAVFRLSWLREEGALARVNWRDMGPEELGSVYESLLELVPVVAQGGRDFAFATGAETKGHARKTTGSYYTPDSLVQVLLDTALEPVVAQTIAANPGRPVEALLELSVVDPACGSGHFLLSAARRLAAHVARFEVNGTPSAEQYRHALRRVVGRCIFGVDLNRMAVELCKVSLWMEAVEPGRPLSFLDSHIQRGNALLGATPELMARGIPDVAWEPIEGDDKKIASALKKQNKKERTALSLDFAPPPASTYARLGAGARAVDEAGDESLPAIESKGAQWAALVESLAYEHQRFVADAWCAAFVWRKEPGKLRELAPTDGAFRALQRDSTRASWELREEVERLRGQYVFFHWYLAFPQVFARGGFDVVLGNPPWERVKLAEQEFFASRSEEIATAPNAAVRKRLIAKLSEENPHLSDDWRITSRKAEGESQWIRQSRRYPLCGKGDVNTYAVFAEQNRAILCSTGRAGFIVPTGIATDDTTKDFFGAITSQGQLASFYSFENEEFVFPAVHHSFKFALMTVDRSCGSEAAELVFFARHVADLSDAHRRTRLSGADIAAISPNTRTCPLFRSKRDAELTLAVARRLPVLVLDAGGSDLAPKSPWGIRIRRILDMGQSSVALQARLVGDEHAGVNGYLPMFEGKMIAAFNHRAASVVRNPQNVQRAALSAASSDNELADPAYVPRAQYVYPARLLESVDPSPHAGRWQLAYKDVTAATNARTVIAAVLPYAATNFSLRIVQFVHRPSRLAGATLVAMLNSFMFDYMIRQSLGGLHVSDYIVHQVRCPTPADLSRHSAWGTSSYDDWLWVQIQYFFTNISARQSPARRDQCVGVRIGRHVPATA